MRVIVIDAVGSVVVTAIDVVVGIDSLVAVVVIDCVDIVVLRVVCKMASQLKLCSEA